MDALDYMGKRGWKLCQTYAISSSSNTLVYHYVLTKEVVSDAEITENLDLKKEK